MKHTIAILSEIFVAAALLLLTGSALVMYWLIAGLFDVLAVAHRHDRHGYAGRH